MAITACGSEVLYSSRCGDGTVRRGDECVVPEPEPDTSSSTVGVGGSDVGITVGVGGFGGGGSVGGAGGIAGAGGGAGGDAGGSSGAGGASMACMVSGNVLYLDGDPQDYVHPGVDTITNATWSAQSDPAEIQISVDPTNNQGFWHAVFRSEMIPAVLAVGNFDDAQRWPFEMSGHPGLQIFGNGNGCNTLTGSFEVHELVLSGQTVTTFMASFSQHCEGAMPELRGCVRYQQ